MIYLTLRRDNPNSLKRLFRTFVPMQLTFEFTVEICFLSQERLIIPYKKSPNHIADQELMMIDFEIWFPVDLIDSLSEPVVYYYYFSRLNGACLEEYELVGNKRLRQLADLQVDRLTLDGLVTVSNYQSTYRVVNFDVRYLKDKTIRNLLSDVLDLFFNGRILNQNTMLIYTLDFVYNSLCVRDALYRSSFEKVEEIY